ncbi:hypothetical protein [Undibacterium squillarum]|uniref:hypothetical protein n=1 Tax=Undibacterium squillarum TaxID=1131567 RepID=UPI0035B0AB20
MSTVLTGLALFLDNAVSVAFERQPFLIDMEDAGTKAWFLMLSIKFLSACVAGCVTVRFSPLRSNRAWMTLLILAVASSIFAQFPQPASAAVLVIWMASAPLGVLCGWLLVRRSALLP